MSTFEHADRPGTFAWGAALAAVAVLGTLATACMMPFVALAVATAATMSRSRAIVLLAGVWAINQLLGFALLGYPFTAYAFAWGAALGIATIVAMLVASAVLAQRPSSAAQLVLAFGAAFVAYEGGLFCFALVAGGTQTFSTKIVLQILTNDAMWFVGMIALQLILTRSAPRMFGPSLTLRPA